MKLLLQKIKMILKNRRFRRIWYRTVGLVSAVMVFITTYALVLPAITLDVSTASMEPGIVFEQAQYRTPASNVTVAAAENSSEETAVETAAEEVQAEEPEQEEPQAPAEESAPEETEASEEETSAEAAPVEEDTQTETPADDTQEEAAPEETKASEEETSAEAAPVEEEPQTEAAPADQPGTTTTEEAAATATTEQAAQFQIPELSELDFDEILTERTGFYFYHNENVDTEGSVSSDAVDEWKKADADTVLAPADFVRVYLPYEIPAGALNETNQTAHFRLPGNLHITDKQVRAINKFENGIYKETRDSKYLGAEAIEGTRTPDEKLHDGEAEYISALVKVENLSDGGQNLVFTFTPYTIGKNQTAYDQDGQVNAEGQKVKGWFTVDFTVDQIDWNVADESTETVEAAESGDGSVTEAKTVTTTTKKAEIIFADDIRATLTLEEKEEIAAEAAAETDEGKKAEAEEKAAAAMPAQNFEETVTVKTGKVSDEQMTEAAEALPGKDKLTVRVEAEEGTFPEGTTMKVTPIKGSKLEEVGAAAADAVDGTACGYQAVDISFINADGKEIEPAKAIRVTMTSDSIAKAAEAEKISASPAIVHVADDGNAEANKNIIADPASDSKDAAADSVVFEADQFSTYVIVYTVDFEYTDPTTGEVYYYSIGGGSSINLTELLVILGVKSEADVEEFVANEVTDVKFSNPELVKVTRNGKELTAFETQDWLLESLQAFDTEETLVITCKDGSDIVIKVTDDVAGATTDLSRLNPTITVSGAELNPDGTYTVKPGKTYSMNIRFLETNGGVQFSDDNEMVLELPQGITFKDISSPFSIPVNDAGTHVTIDGNTARVDGNKLYIKLNKNAPGYEHLQNVTTASITVNATAEFSSTSGQNEYVFPGGGTYKVDTTPDVNIQKSGRLVNFDTGEVEYTLNVTSNGSNNGVTITDTITGDALTFAGQVTMKDSSGNTVFCSVTPQNNKGFTLKTAPLANGNYTITYKATLDKSKLTQTQNGLGNPQDTRNKITWDGDKETTHNFGHIVNKPGSWKGAEKTTTNADGTATTQWVIRADSNYLEDWRLKTVTDTIKSDGVRYSGQGITVVIYDQFTNQKVGTEHFISWNTLGVNPSTATGWTINDVSGFSGLPNNTGKYWRYEFHYTTEYDASSLEEAVQIKNEETTNNDPTPHEGTAYVQPTPDNQTGIGKTAVKVTGDEITWRIVLNIPKNGVRAEKAFVTEVLPTSYKGLKDTYVADSFQYSQGSQHIEPSEGISNVTITENADGTVTFKWNNGFASSNGARQVRFEFKTKNNEEWMNDASENPKHQNHAIFNGNHAWADAEPVLPMLVKTGSEAREENGELYYDFDVVTNQITDDNIGNGLTFTDTYDSHLEYVEGTARIYGGDSKNNINTGEKSVTPTVSAGENKITFNFNKTDLPQTGSLKLYSFYRLHYSMRVKNKEELIEAALSSTGYTIKMNNSITTDFGDASTTVEYTPEILDKKKIDEAGGRVKFEIKVNELKRDLISGDVLKLTDTLTNLSSHYEDIQIVVQDYDTPVIGTDEAGNEVDLPYFNMKGDTVTFYLPDGYTSIITYWAKAVGEADDDGMIHYSNVAKLHGYEKSVSDKIKYSGDASGTATNYGIKLYKADGYVNSRMLAGAKFKVYIVDEVDEDGNIISGTPLKDENGNDYTVTSSDEGTVEIKGNAELGWNLLPETRYYLLEVEAPENCAIDNTKYSFTISSNGNVNYTANAIKAPDGSGAIIQPWTYYNGDILTVKNYPKEGELEIKKTFQGIEASRLDDDQKAAIRFDIYKLGDDGAYAKIKSVGYDEFTSDTYTIGDLQAGTYKVVEVVNDQNCTATTYSVTDPADSVHNEGANKDRYATIVISEEDIRNKQTSSVEVKNTYDIPSEFKVYKYANLVSGHKDMKLSGAEFGVFSCNNGTITESQVGESYTTNSRGRFSVVPGKNNVEYNTLYGIREIKAPTGYKVSENVYYVYFTRENNTAPNNLPQGTVVIPYKQSASQDIPDEIGTTKIGAEKIWQNDLLETDENKKDPVKVKIVRTATYDKTGVVVEENNTGYYPANVVFDLTYSEAERIWKLSQPDGATLPDGVTINEDGELTGLPTMTVLPNGAPLYYRYTVEEQPVSGYTASYDHETNTEGVKATITNRPSSVTSFVSVKAEKKWVDEAGNDITENMGYNDGVSVDVYRTTGVVTDGKIIEADGTEKDAGDLFSVAMIVGNGNQGGTPVFSQSAVVCLPGDTIRITVSPKYNNSSTPISANDFEVVTGKSLDYTNINNGTIIPAKGVDTANKQIVYECTAEKIDFAAISVKAKSSQVKSSVVQVENISAQGRTQILTQDEAVSVGGTTIVQTLDLNKQNGWKAESREFPAGSKGNVYSYYIVEPKGKDYDASYSVSGDSVIVTNTDKKLRVDKKWFEPDGETPMDDQKDAKIVYNLYQVKNDVEWKDLADEEFAGGGPFGVSIAGLRFGDPNNPGQSMPGSIKLEGDTTGIKAGSTVEIEITTNNPHDSNLDPNSYNNTYTVIGGDVTYGEQHTEYNGPNAGQSITITVSNVNAAIKFQGYMEIQRGCNAVFKVKVKGQYEPVPISEEHYKDTRIGQVTMTYEKSDIVLDEAFADSKISAKQGTAPWTSIVSNLPEKGENGVTYTYYVTEEEIAGFEQMDADSIVPVSNAGTVTLKNKAESGKVKVTKAFKGLANGDIPADFKITASYRSKEFTLTTSGDQPENVTRTGNGTEDNPYVWTIDKVPVGTEVSFTETGILVDNKMLTVNGTATTANAATVTAAATKEEPTADNGGTASLVNEYEDFKGSLKLTKLVKVNEADPDTDAKKALTNGTYSFTITGPNDETGTHTVTITYTGGSITAATVDGTTVTTIPADGYIEVADLTPGTYTIAETSPDNGMILLTAEGGKSVSDDKVVTVEVTGGKKGSQVEASGIAAFTNNIQLTDFEFTKEWRDDSDQPVSTWKDDVAITVKVQRKVGAEGSPEEIGTYTITKTQSGFTYVKSEGAPDLTNTDGTFTFKITDLPSRGKIGDQSGDYIYFATETEVVQGYKEATYMNPSAASTSGEWTTGEYALNKGKIINRPVESYELPYTGGPGTKLFTLLGSMLLLGTGMVLIMRRRRVF